MDLVRMSRELVVQLREALGGLPAVRRDIALDRIEACGRLRAVGTESLPSRVDAGQRLMDFQLPPRNFSASTPAAVT